MVTNRHYHHCQRRGAKLVEAMATDRDISTLQRKARAGLQEHQARAMSVPKALRVAMAKVADDLFDMALSVIGATVERRSHEAAMAQIDDGALLILLDGPDRRVGAAFVSPLVVGALIQQQTTGRVRPSDGAERAMTATDAALCVPLIDALFERAVSLLDSDRDRAILAPYCYGSRAEDKRLLAMALDLPEYDLIRLTLDIAGGTRQGQLVLCLPVTTAAERPDTAHHQGQTAERPRATLGDTVMCLHADLTVALCRVRLTVKRLGDLAVGDVLELPTDAFSATRLTTTTGRTLATGTLGQVEGLRALRLAHHPAGMGSPQRRAGDREGLDQPTLGPALSASDVLDHVEIGDTATSLPDSDPLPDLPELSDLSDLPELDDLPRLNTA